VETKDDDFFDVDYLKNGNSRIAVLCHGLEGSSQSHYIQATSKILHNDGYDIAAMNYRGCSGELNRQAYSYHSGSTGDLHLLIESLVSSYNEIVLVGFSLGGNLVLKYSCDENYPLDARIKGVVAISVPVDLYAASIKFLKFSNKLYTLNFLKTLLAKIKLKHQQFPDLITLEDISKIKSILDFDNYITAPLNGFIDAKDYYSKCNSKQFLQNCKRPTLIINALDDPFLAESCFPLDVASKSEYLNLLMPRYGGHLGFVNNGLDYYWNEFQTLEFLKRQE
jgi:predicted alpha/beta-fold hydrolase